MIITKKSVELLIKRDSKTYEQICFEYYDNMLSIALYWLKNRMDAEDITQQLLTDLPSLVVKYDPDKSTFSTWLSKVLVNRCKDEIRRRQRKNKFEVNEIGYSMKEFYALDWSIEDLRHSFTDTEYAMVLLHFVYGYTYKQIANILDMGESNVKKKVREKVKSLRKEKLGV